MLISGVFLYSLLVILSGSGLMLHRIVEGILVYFEKSIIDRFLITIVIETVLMCILILVYVLFFVKKNVASKNDKVKKIAVKILISSFLVLPILDTS